MNARDVALGSCTSERRLILAMIGSPSSLWGEPAELCSSVSWDRFLASADDFLKPYLHFVTERPPFDSLVPAPIIDTLAAERRLTGMRNLRWVTELRSIAEAFRREGLGLILVKGAVLQRTVYPDASTRPMRDVDLLVRRDEMQRAQAVLAGLGFANRAAADDFTPWHGLQADEEAFFYKQVGDRVLLLEVHTRVELEVPAYSGGPAQIWDRAVEVRTADGLAVRTLAPDLALRHLCLHLAKHGFDHGLMWLLDIRLFLERHAESIDWNEFRAQCGPSTMPVISFTLALVAEWLGGKSVPGCEDALPADKRAEAVRLVWEQIWEYHHGRQPPNVLVSLLSGDLPKIWRAVYGRVVRWKSPIQGRRMNPLVLAGRRFRADWEIFRAAWREGGFRLSSMRTARRSDRRSSELRALLGLPLDG